ncbi:hypothetical protein OKW41_004896 [Paraburkholderia sp. UCT70]
MTAFVITKKKVRFFRSWISVISAFSSTPPHRTLEPYPRRRCLMQVLFKSRDREAVRLRGFARQRIRFVFRRMDWLISKATVSMSDINGPRGGLDKRCQVQVQTPDATPVVVTSIARDWRGALDLALARAARSIIRRQQARIATRGPRDFDAVYGR